MCLHIRLHTNTQRVAEDVDSAAAVGLSSTVFLVNLGEPKVVRVDHKSPKTK